MHTSFSLFLVSCFFFVASCGYQLQPALQLSNDFQPIYVEGELQLKTALRRALKRQSIQITDSRSLANSIVTLSNTHTESRGYSLSSDARNAEFLVIARATLQWRRSRFNSERAPSNTEPKQSDTNHTPLSTKDASLVPAVELSAETIQLQNPDQLNAQQQESSLVSEELRSALVEKMLRLIRYHQAQ